MSNPRDALDLVIGGLRCRFGLPRGKANRAMAVLAALSVGVAMSAAAGLVTWRALPTVPTHAQAVAAAAAAMPLQAQETEPSAHHPLDLNFGMEDLSHAHLPPGADPATGKIDISYRTAPEAVPALMDQSRRRLAEAGWRVADMQGGAFTESKDDIVVPGYSSSFWAAKADRVVQVRGVGGPIGDAPSIQVSVHHQAPGLVTVTAVAGLLAGWLLAAWILRAYRHHRPWGRVLLVATGLPGLLAGGLLALMCAGAVILLGSVQGWDAQDSLAPATVLASTAPLTATAMAGLFACAVVAAFAPPAGRTALPAPIPADQSPAH